jgi:hypothetical protein
LPRKTPTSTSKSAVSCNRHATPEPERSGSGVFIVANVQGVPAAAICTASLIVSTFRDIHHEVFGFGAITAGYCSLYVAERLFPTSLAKALLPSVTVGLGLAALFGWLIPQHAALPLVALTCAACGRLLEGVQMPFVCFAGRGAGRFRSSLCKQARPCDKPRTVAPRFQSKIARHGK